MLDWNSNEVWTTIVVLVTAYFVGKHFNKRLDNIEGKLNQLYDWEGGDERLEQEEKDLND